MSGVSDEAVITVKDKLRVGKIGKTKLVKRYWPHQWADEFRDMDMGRRGESSRQIIISTEEEDQQRRQEDEDEDEMVVIEEVDVEEEEDLECNETTTDYDQEEQTGLMDMVKKPAIYVPNAADREIGVERIMIHDNNNLELEEAANDVDTDDELNQAEEYEAWKARERARIKRYREDPDMRW